MSDPDDDDRPSAVDPKTLAVIVLLVPLAEEWAYRGVLWVAFERVVKHPFMIVVATATIFAFAHVTPGSEEALLLVVPHRLFAGLLLAVLRWKTGRLAPAVFAHASLNLMASVAA